MRFVNLAHKRIERISWREGFMRLDHLHGRGWAFQHPSRTMQLSLPKRSGQRPSTVLLREKSNFRHQRNFRET